MENAVEDLYCGRAELVGEREVLGSRAEVRKQIIHGNPFAASEKGLAFVKTTAVFFSYWFHIRRLVFVDQNFEQMEDGGSWPGFSCPSSSWALNSRGFMAIGSPLIRVEYEPLCIVSLTEVFVL